MYQNQMSPFPYLTNRGFIVTYAMFGGKDEKKKEMEKIKQTKLLFSDYDLLSDKEREEELYVYTDEEYIKENPEFEIFS